MTHYRGKIEENLVLEAMRRIDPDATLVPGTLEYDTIKDMIICWLEQCGPEYALFMAEVGAKHLDRWRKLL